MSLPKVPNPAQVVLELPPGYEGSGDPRPRSAEPTAVILASDILRWLILKVGKFPKNVRFGLGARLETALIAAFAEIGATCIRHLFPLPLPARGRAAAPRGCRRPTPPRCRW